MRVATLLGGRTLHKVFSMAQIPVLEAAPGQEGASAPKKRPMLLIIIAAVVLLAGGGGAAWYFLGSHGDAAKGKNAKSKPHEEAPKGPPIYVALDPPFVVNFEAEQL